MGKPTWSVVRKARWGGRLSWWPQRAFIVLVLPLMSAPLLVVMATSGKDSDLQREAILNQSCGAGGTEFVVKNVSSLYVSNFGRPGLAHTTIAGAVHHGMREVEVWLQTFAPGSGTPIHRHACEEVFLVVRGTGIVHIATGHLTDSELPGSVTEHTYSMNNTFTVPFDAVHQVRNVAESGDLQLLVVISQPPIQVHTYDSWTTPHKEAKLVFPYPWDAICPQTESAAASLEAGGQEGEEGIVFLATESASPIDLATDGASLEGGGQEAEEWKPAKTPASEHAVRLFHSVVVAQQESGGLNEEPLRLESIASLAHEALPIARGSLDQRKALPMQPDEGGIQKKVIDELLRPGGWEAPRGGRFFLEADEIVALCDASERLFTNEPSVLRVRAPVKIFGDLHGQFADLLRFFEAFGEPSVGGDITYVDYLFLGDYIDRGDHSLETITLLLALKIMHPRSIHLLRGNHETESVNQLGGFLTECIGRLGHRKGIVVHARFNDLFRWLPLAAVIDGKILCVHGGIGASIETIEEIERIVRPIGEARANNDVQELLWSDPTPDDSVLGVHKNRRGKSISSFGPDRVHEFCERNGLELIVRAHEQVVDGFRRSAGGRLITLFSAPKYRGRGKNAGAILVVGRDHIVVPKLLRPSSWQGMP